MSIRGNLIQCRVELRGDAFIQDRDRTSSCPNIWSVGWGQDMAFCSADVKSVQESASTDIGTDPRLYYHLGKGICTSRDPRALFQLGNGTCTSRVDLAAGLLVYFPASSRQDINLFLRNRWMGGYLDLHARYDLLFILLRIIMR